MTQCLWYQHRAHRRPRRRTAVLLQESHHLSHDPPNGELCSRRRSDRSRSAAPFDRSYRGVQANFSLTIFVQRIYAAVLPDFGSVATVLAELKAVNVVGVPRLE